MSIEAPLTISPSRPRDFKPQVWLPLAVGLLVLSLPTIISMGRQTWSTEAGAHGPIVIATGIWLLYHNRLSIAQARGTWSLAAIPAVGGLAAYVFGRAYDFISIEAFGVYVVALAFILRLSGWREVRRNAFPLVYLGFAIPPPGWLIDRATAPLQILVSRTAEVITKGLGYPVARQGVALDVGPYQLLVEQACAGMNSIMGLTAVSLLYIYLMRGMASRAALVLVLMIVPVAIIVNILRVTVLILVTYHFGDAAAQGFLHATTGIALFGAAVLIIFAIDWMLGRLIGRAG